MKNKKYFFNPDSLTYIEIKFSSIELLFRPLISKIIIFSTCLILLFSLITIFFETPQISILKLENEKLYKYIEDVNKRFDEVVTRLSELQKKDSKIYRSFFNNPLNQEVRQAGFGGTDKYMNLNEFSRPDLLIETSKKIDKLSKQLDIQNHSFEELIVLVKEKKNKLKHIPAIQPVSQNDLLYPPHGYGNRIDPIYNVPAFHFGMDFTAPEGTKVYATADGIILSTSSNLNGYGLYISMEHGYGYSTLYGHLSKTLVRQGQKVKRGEVIGLVGNTGKSVAPHLHYEVKINNIPVNPSQYFYHDLTPQQYDVLIKDAIIKGTSLD